jgi:hypothetical protein
MTGGRYRAERVRPAGVRAEPGVFGPWSLGARYAGSDASGECDRGVVGTGAFRRRWSAG